MASLSLWARARRSLRYRGLRRSVRIGWALAAYRWRRGGRAPRPYAFDLEYGTDTVSLAEAGDGHGPIDPVEFDALLAELSVIHPDFTFIDMGAGQGRALMLASRYPFARVIGIEKAEERHRSAERNLARWAERGARQYCNQVLSIRADAASWELPQVPSVFYFSELLMEAEMRDLAERVRASLQAAPRPAYVLCVGEAHPGVWEEPGDFERLGGRDCGRVYRWRGGESA